MSDQEEDFELERSRLISDWHLAFKKGTDFDLWGQPVESTEVYTRLSRNIRGFCSNTDPLFTDEQKKVIGKIAACLDMRVKDLQNLGKIEEITLEDLNKVEQSLKNLESMKSKEFPLEVSAVQPSTPRISPADSPSHTPGVSLAKNDDEEKDDIISQKSKGSILPPPPPIPGQTMVVIRIEKIGLKEAFQYIDPYITMSVRDLYGQSVTAVQDTPVAGNREDNHIFFGMDLYLQKPLEVLPHGFAIFFEFKHYKPKKRMVSTKCWAFLERDEMKEGPVIIELYKKPTDSRRKKLNLLTVKPLYLHLKLTMN